MKEYLKITEKEIISNKIFMEKVDFNVENCPQEIKDVHSGFIEDNKKNKNVEYVLKNHDSFIHEMGHLIAGLQTGIFDFVFLRVNGTSIYVKDNSLYRTKQKIYYREKVPENPRNNTYKLIRNLNTLHKHFDIIIKNIDVRFFNTGNICVLRLKNKDLEKNQLKEGYLKYAKGSIISWPLYSSNINIKFKSDKSRVNALVSQKEGSVDEIKNLIETLANQFEKQTQRL